MLGGSVQAHWIVDVAAVVLPRSAGVDKVLDAGSYTSLHQLRAKYWEKDFSQIKTEFLSAFASTLSGNEVDDIEHVYHLRNMIGHAHVSIARNYMLFRPGGKKREQAVVDAFKPEPITDQSDSLMFKLEFWKPDKFKAFSDLMERVDQQCFDRVAADLGVPHGRIR